MNTRISLLQKILIAIITVGGTLFAKDMVLTTPDGADILLRDDSTWTFQGQKKADIEEDFTVPVTGGRVILISADGTWGFVKDEIKKEKELIPMDTIVARGHAVHADVAVATAQAMKQVNTMATERMKRALGNIKINPAKLADCVRRVEKDIDKKEEFKKGHGWSVSITAILDRGSILAVAECARKDKKPEPGDSDTSATKK